MLKKTFIILLVSSYTIFYAQSNNVLQSFSENDYLNSPNTDKLVDTGCSCVYSNTIEENRKGKYIYMDGYKEYAVIKFNSKFYEFTIQKHENNFATKKGFITGVYKNKYTIRLDTFPVMKNGRYEYSKTILKLQNLNNKKITTINIYGYCGC